MTELQSVNHSTIAAFFSDLLKVLWPNQILYENVLAVTTDIAPYMCKAMRGLQVLFPKMVHETCLTHGLYRVAELVKTKFLDVNQLISSSKSMFLKASQRVQKSRYIYPQILLPPSPVITKWGTSWKPHNIIPLICTN